MLLYTDPYRYDNDGPELVPRFIGYYSSGDGGEASEDTSRLKYVKKTLGEVNWDLRPSHESTTSRSLNEEQGSFFRYLRNHQDLLNRHECNSDIMHSKIVSSRSVILNIANVPYVNDGEFAFCAHLLNGVIYLYTPTKSSDADLQQHAHFRREKKFQKHLTTGQANGVPDPNERVIEKEEFVGIYELNLQHHTIIYKSDIDGILLNETESEADLYGRFNRDKIIADVNCRGVVEMKTSRWKDHCYIFRCLTSRHFWISGTLGMAFDTIIGFIDEDGFVKENKMYDLEEFEEIGTGKWKRNIMTNFISDFMTYIKNRMANSLRGKDINTTEMIIYFMKEPDSPIFQSAKSHVHSYDWIPEWYLETIRQNVQEKIN